MKKKTFFITTPIYYPSGDLHIGHLYTTTLAWVLRNYKQLQGYDAKMLTGSDEHGQKIEQKAEKEKMNPQAYVDMQVEKFKVLWDKAQIDYDYFSRTTNKNHMKVVLNVFEELLNKEVIYKGTYKGLYSISSEEFLTPTQAELKEDGKYYHPISGDQLVEVEEESYFFKMSLFEKWLLEYWENNYKFIFPNKILNELKKNFLEKGLEDLSVTRISFKWGIPLNNDPKHVIYVWLDALFNYVSALNYSLENDEEYKKYWAEGDEVVHIVGKEITRFHCIYWPIMLKALELRIPDTILSHGLIRDAQGRKMSKSLGNVVDPIELLNNYDPEVVKYFFATQISIAQDGIFDEKMLKEIYNAHLANNYGNLVSRTIAMIKQSFANEVKYHQEKLTETEKEIYSLILETKEKFASYMDAFEIDKAYKEVITLSKALNGYIDITTPWLLKDNLERLEVVLNTLLNGIYAVTVMLSPILREKTKLVFDQLQLENSLSLIEKWDKFNDKVVQKGEVLFERIK